MKRILLTRSEEENNKIACRLKGFEVLSCPMIFYKDLEVDWQSFKGFSYLIITSKYAAELVSKNYPFEIIAYVVGEESAKLLSKNTNISLGGIFEDVDSLYSSSGLLRQLSELPCNDEQLYLSGNHITKEISFATRKEIYHTQYASKIDVTLFIDPIDYVLIYSKNSANNLISLLKKHNLLQRIENSVSISISKNVSDVLKGYVSKSLYPKKPIADEMLELLIENERKER